MLSNGQYLTRNNETENISLLDTAKNDFKLVARKR